MTYRLVLWDFDGTLADTLRSAVEIYNRIAPKYHALPMTNPEAMRGMTAAELVRRHNIRCHRFPFLIREFLAEQGRTMTEVQLHPGIIETLEALSRIRAKARDCVFQLRSQHPHLPAKSRGRSGTSSSWWA